jgi:hypothetical protein
MTVRLNSPFFNAMVEVSDEKLMELENSIFKSDRKFAKLVRVFKSMRDYDWRRFGPLDSEIYFKINLLTSQVIKIEETEIERSYLEREKERWLGFILSLGIDPLVIYSETASDSISLLQHLYKNGFLSETKSDFLHIQDELISSLKSTHLVGSSMISLSPAGVVQGVWNLGTSVAGVILDTAFAIVSAPLRGLKFLFRPSPEIRNLETNLKEWIIQGGSKFHLSMTVEGEERSGEIVFHDNKDGTLGASLTLEGRRVKDFQWISAYLEGLSDENLFFAKFEDQGTDFGWIGIVEESKNLKISGKIINGQPPLPDPSERDPLWRWTTRILAAYSRLLKEPEIGSFLIE